MKRLLLGFFLLIAAALPVHAVEVDLQWEKGTTFFDDSGSILDSGTINIYDAGTTDLRTTYSDEDGTVANTLNGSNQIVLGSDGRLSESVYIPTGSWKFVLRDSGATALVTEDNIEGALDTSVFATGTVAWTLPVLSKSSDYTVTTSDLGKCVNANPTAATVTLTLPSASTAGDGKTLCVKHVGTANTVVIATVSSQTIDGYDTFVLSDQNDTALLYSDGANWHIAAQSTPAGSIQFVVADRLTSPPASPTPGAWYIINGTPTGDWSTYADEDIVRAAGDGGWHKYTPPTDAGWQAFVQDENIQTQFRDSAWVDWSNITAPTASALGSYVVTYQEDDGTAGDSTSQAAWTKYPLSTEVDNGTDITGASLASSVITLDSGEYVLDFAGAFRTSDATSVRWRRTNNTAATLCNGPVVDPDGGTAITISAHVKCAFTVGTDDSTFEIQYYVVGSGGSLGVASSESGTPEVYGILRITSVTAEQGPIGATGPQGAQGAAGLDGIQFTFDTDVDSGSDNDAGDLRLSSATLSSVTQVIIDDADANAADISTAILAWDDSDSTTRGTITIQAPDTPSDFAVYQITGAITDNSGWSVIPVSHIDSNGTFTEDESVSASFSRTGDTGDIGATGAQGIAGPVVDPTWTYDTGVTGADPTSGNFALSSETLSSVTRAYFDDESTSGGAVDVGAWLATWDDFGTTSNRGQLFLIDASDPTAFAIYDLTAISDSSGYWTATVSHVASNGTLAGEVAISFAARGDTGSGDVTGPGSSTDNALARFDGAGGDTLQNSGITVDDSGNLTAGGTVDMNGLSFLLDPDADTSINANNDDEVSFVISAATDFQMTANTFSVLTGSTLNAADTGSLQENSVSISPIGQQTIFWPAPALLSRSTNGCASGSTESSTNDVNVSTFDCDALTNEGVQTPMFQMPKGWNEGTVMAEVVWLSSATTSSVVWGISGQCFGDSDLLDSSFGTQVTAADTGLNAVDVAESGELGPVTLSNATEEGACVIELERQADDGSDTIVADVSILGLRLHITLDAATDN